MAIVAAHYNWGGTKSAVCEWYKTEADNRDIQLLLCIYISAINKNELPAHFGKGRLDYVDEYICNGNLCKPIERDLKIFHSINQERTMVVYDPNKGKEE